jgi:hypothetical protein
LYRDSLSTLVQTLAGLWDEAAALRSAATLRDLGWDPAADAYDAACALAQCIPVVERDHPVDYQRRQQQAKVYADRALAMLRLAAARGFADLGRLRKDNDLDPLRQRPEFQQLLAELEAKPKAEP